jgi:starch-binding outer membrane protein, SusD/RagB family
MRTHKIKILAPLAAVLLATGCLDNPLNLDNPNQRTVEAFWQSEGDALAGMSAVYRTLYNNGTYGRNRYWMWGRTDTYMSRSPAGAIQNSVRGIITDYNYGGFLGGMWTDPWQGIFRANQVIHHVPAMEIAGALKERLVAEAKFIRALYHFEHVLLFGDVPIVTEMLDASAAPEFRPAADVYAHVIKDATEAAAVLPWRYTGSDIGRATRGGALALAAEAHMMLGQWNQAVPLLQQIVGSGQYQLLPNFADLFRIPQGEHSVESLFEVAFGDNNDESQGARGNVNPRLVGPSSGRGSALGFNDIQPTQWAFEQFFAEPGRSYPDNPDPRLDATVFWNKPGGMDVFGMPFHLRYRDTGPGGGGGFRDTDLDHTYFFKKYQEYWLPQLTNFSNPINLKIYRYGGVLLMLAEALTEVGDVGAAAQHLNTLRARVGLPAVPAMNQAEMREWINREFVLELMWETGNRMKYLKRHNLLNKEYLTPRNPFHGSLFINGKNELIPIMQTEIDRNPNARQNPGW